MILTPSTAARFAREESFRCDLLRKIARRASGSRERGGGAFEEPSSHAASGAADLATKELKESVHQPAHPSKENTHQPVQPVASLKGNVDQPIQPDRSPQDPVADAVEPPWQYPDRAWRKHPLVAKYSNEALVFIPADAYPTHDDAAFSLIAWLRQPGMLSRPLKKSLHSGVVKVEGLGWVVTFGNIAGALDRMILFLEWKAGQTLIFKGKRHIIKMHTHIPLEWML